MFFINECAACVVVAMIVATVAVLGCAILLLFNAGRSIMEWPMNQLMRGANSVQSAGLAAKPLEP